MLDLASLRIFFVAGTLGQGGAERQLFYILQALRENRTDLQLLCLTRGEYWESKIAELGVPVTWVGDAESKLVRLRRIVQIIRKKRPQIVQSQHFYTNLYAAAAARFLGIRDIGAVRNDGISEVRANGNFFGRLSLLTPRMIAANSLSAMRNATALGLSNERLKLLPNVVNCNSFHPAPVRRQEPIKLLAIGRMVEQKRYDLFLRTLRRVQSDTVAKVVGVIVGDGPDRAKLESQASELGLFPDQIEFRGQISDTAPVYREADIFVLTSAWEGTPNVVLEAMASGLPVVATRVGGVPDIVRHGETGFLVDPANENEMVAAISRLIHVPELREEVGRRARNYVLMNHSPERLPMFLKELYEMTLA